MTHTKLKDSYDEYISYVTCIFKYFCQPVQQVFIICLERFNFSKGNRKHDGVDRGLISAADSRYISLYGRGIFPVDVCESISVAYSAMVKLAKLVINVAWLRAKKK